MVRPSVLTAGACAAAVLVVSGSASAAVTTTNPGWVADSTLFEARMRVDAGNSQTWKSAFWADGNLGSTSGNAQNLWNDGVTYSFELIYTASTGAAALTVFGLNGGDRVTVDTITLDAGDGVAGFRYYARSQNNGIGSTTLSNLSLDVDGDVVALADLESGLADTWVETQNLFFTSNDVESVVITGNVNFDWLDSLSGSDINSNLKNERFKAGFYFIEADGTAVPTAGTAMLAGVAGLAAARRRRS